MARARPGQLIYRLNDTTEEYIPLTNDVMTIGRSENCDIVIPHSTVSRLHARISLEHDRYVLSDAGSFNGTFVDGKRISQPHQLGTNDEIWLGSSEVVLSFSDPDETVDVAFANGPPALFIDHAAHVIQVYGIPVQLTTLEFDLLFYLVQHPRKVCTREECFVAAWKQSYDPTTCEDALNACVARLRRNLRAAAEQAGQEPPQITTLKRIGLRLDSDVALASVPQAAADLREREVNVSFEC